MELRHAILLFCMVPLPATQSLGDGPGGDCEIARCVPGDAIAAVLIRPGHSGLGGPASLATAASFLGQARNMGMLSGIDFRSSLIIDGLAAIPELTNASPSGIAIVLIDVRAESLGRGSHRLAGMQLGIVVRSDAPATALPILVQRLLNRYTNSEVARVESSELRGLTRHRLVHSDFPAWAVFEWGAVGDHYVIGFGIGVFAAIERTFSDSAVSLARDSWFRRAWESSGGSSSAITTYVDIERLRSSLSSGLDGVEENVTAVLDCSDVKRSVWTIGARQRALRWEAYQHVDGRDRRSELTSAAELDDFETGFVPIDAAWYALFHWEPAEFVNGVSRAYLLSRRPAVREELCAYWDMLQRELGVSIDRDLLSQLGRRFIMHDDPPHPLGLDLLCTLQFEITGSADRVRVTVDKLMERRRREMTDIDENALCSLRRGNDGVWCLHFGIQGPAVAVHNRWLIIGPSPAAVRHNIYRLNRLSPMADRGRPAP